MNSLRARTLSLGFSAGFLLAALPASAAVVQIQKALPSDFTVDAPLNVPDTRMGESVAVSGNWMAVGAPGSSVVAGSVALYERVANAWTFRLNLASPAPQAGEGFGSDVGIFEAAGIVTVIVGAPQFDGAQVDQGRAFVFVDSDPSAALNFSITAPLLPASPDAAGRYGKAVALFADLAAVSEPGDGILDTGIVSIRGRNQGGANAWGQLAATAGDPASGFGASVDLHGEYLIVGAPTGVSGGVRSGLARVFRQDLGGPNAFGLKHTLGPNVPQAGMAFGQSVGVWDSNLGAADSASRSMVGNPLRDDGGFADTGGAAFFNDGSVATSITYVGNASNLNGQGGYSVAIEGNEAITSRTGVFSNAGALTTFSFSGSWIANGTLTQSSGSSNEFLGWSVDLSGTLAVAGAPGETASETLLPPGAQRAGAITTLAKPALWVIETSEILALADLPTLSTDQQFSDDIAMSADWLAVGVEGDDNQKGVDAGAVYLYRNNAGVWTPHSKLTALYGRAGDHFGQGLAIDGNRLIVGAPTFDGFPTATSNAGAVYVFDFNGSAWGQTVERMAPTPAVDAFFGNRLDLMGDVLAVSATGENTNAGAVYAYRDLALLTGAIPLPIPGLTSGAGAGFGVSVYDPAVGTANDESIAVGALFLNAGVGAAWVFSGATFSSVVPLANPTPAVRFFGNGVSIFNGRVAVGAPTGSPAPSGAVHVFSGPGYANLQTLTASGTPGQFGLDVELDDTRLLVGAPATNGRAGSAYVYSRSGSTFTESAIALPADLLANDEYGVTLAMANGTYVIGAPLHDAAGNAVGAAYLFEEAPEVTVTPTSLSVSETGPTSSSFNVSLNQAPTSNVTIALTFGPDVQVDTGSGFGVSPQTVTLTPANALGGVNVGVRAVDDAIDEIDPEAITITTANTASAQLRFNNLAVADVNVDVADNDTAGVTITQTAGSTAVSESGATDTYTIVLDSQPTANVNVAVTFPASELIVNGDTDGSFNTSFTSGNWNVPQMITVAAVDDRALEGNHSGNLVHAFTSGDAAYQGITARIDGTPGNSLAVGITDNETAVVEWTPTSGSAAEGSIVATAVRLDITAIPAGGTPILEGSITANIGLTLGSAEAPDLGAIPPSVNFVNASDLTSLPVNVPHANDTLVEGSETYTLTLSLGGAPLGTTVSATPFSGTILDLQSASVSLSAAASVGEAVGTTPLTVTLSTGAGNTLENGLTVAVNLIDGSATYNAGNGDMRLPGPANAANVVFAAGSGHNATQAASVQIVDDALVEGSEGYSASIGTITGAATAAGGPVATTIVDNDTAAISFQAPTSNAAEGASPHTVQALLDITANGTGTPALAVSVSAVVNATPVSAATPADFSLTTTSVSFPVAAVDNATQAIQSTIVDDPISEPTETYTLGFGAVTGPGTATGTHTVSIIDNDTPGFVVAQSGGTTVVAEGGASDDFTVVLTSQPTSNVVVTLTGTQVTAAPTPLTFTSGDWNVPKPVTVTAVDDAIDEASPHSGSVSFAVASSDGNYNNFVVAPVDVSVTDNDTAGVTVVQSGGNTAVTEGGATDSYTVVLTSEPTSNVTIAVTTGTQVGASPGSLVFTAGNWNVAQPVTLTAVDDNLVEGPHNDAVSHGASSGDPNYSGIPVAGFPVTITDNDSAVVGFAQVLRMQTEATTPMVFTVSLSQPVASGVTLTLNSADAGATAADYTPIVNATVSFPPASNASQTVNVTIANDALDEADENFTLTLSNLVATGNVALAPSTATGVILDDDPTPTLSITSPSQPEGNAGTSVMNFVVSLSAVSGRDVSFTRATADGTATVADNDYVAIPPGILTIPAGQSSVTIPVTINGNTVFEGNETFSVNLTGITNADPASLTGTGTIEDDDQQPTTTTITSDTPDPSVVGQPYTVSVRVSAVTLSPAGTVTVSDGTASCGPVTLVAGTAPDSTASCNLTSTTAGAKTLTASYTPASTAFAPSSGTASHQVNPASTRISVTGPVRSRINQPTTFSFALIVDAPGAGTPTGTVTLSSGTASCIATLPATSCDLSFDSLGTRSVSASYAGDGNYAPSASSGAGNAQTLVYALSDLAISKTDGVGTYVPGELLVYTVLVRNLGPDDATGIRVQDTIPAGLVDVVWSCDASGGVACPVSGGSGNLDVTTGAFPVDAVLNFTFYGNVAGNPPQLVNTATLGLPVDTTVEDPVTGNNSATDTNIPELLFEDGFESPVIDAASGERRLPSLSSVLGLDQNARLLLSLDDVQGEAVRVYLRLHAGQPQLALARRAAANGLLRLEAWRAPGADPLLRWTARQAPAGWVLESAELR